MRLAFLLVGFIVGSAATTARQPYPLRLPPDAVSHPGGLYAAIPPPTWFTTIPQPNAIPWEENLCISNAPCYNWTMIQQIPDSYCERGIYSGTIQITGVPATCSPGRTLSGNMYHKHLNLVLAKDPPYVYYSASRTGNARFTGMMPEALG